VQQPQKLPQMRQPLLPLPQKRLQMRLLSGYKNERRLAT
jgi:hypothetical protein